MSAAPIRIGIIGAGANTTSKHIPGLQAIPGVAIVSVCNRTQASGERVARQFNIPQVYTNWLDVTEADDVDVGSHASSSRSPSTSR